MPFGENKQFVAWGEWKRFGSIIPACLIGMVIASTHTYALGVMIGPLEREFGWARSEISAGPLVTSITTLLVSPFAGRALDRFGPRRIALIGVPSFCVALSLISTAGPSIFSWLGLYVLFGFALTLVFPTIWTAAIAARFERNRGLALAIALSGSGIASAIVPLLASRLIEEFGWRGAYIALGTLSFIVAFPLIYFLFDRDDTHTRNVQKVAALPRSSVAAEYRSARFIIMAIAVWIYAMAATGLGVNLVPILVAEGFSLRDAAPIAGLLGVGIIVGRMAGGMLLDRIEGRFVATGCSIAAVSSAGFLLATDHSAPAASVASILLGLSAGAEYDACAYMATRYFSRRHFGALFGVIGALSAVGAGFAPLLANAIYDLTGSYDLVLWGIMPLFLIASLLFLALGRYPAEELPSA